MNLNQTKVLFVCLGNICRSPLAEGAFRAHVKDRGLDDLFEVDSAGTSAYHAGEHPDPRSIDVARRNGVNIERQRSRQLIAADFDVYHYIVAMDDSNLRNMRRLTTRSSRAQLSLMLDELGDPGRDVPDPYYGGASGFETVWSMVNSASHALLDRILSERG